MDHYSILDQNPSPATGSLQNVMPQLGTEPAPQPAATPFVQGSISAAIAAANAAAGPAPALPPPMRHGLRFPGDDGGRSLADMAQRDLDAALQLLAERAQYITGASGAAIALRRDGRDDMLCRASAGSNAPELGALLSTQAGLSGESVRTRLPLRCDDTERDPRVNRDGCRELGIASVLILPILGGDEVLGVFELFSGEVNAFTERDLSALQRLGEMVETAVQLAHAAENPLPQILAPELHEAAPQVGVSQAGIQGHGEDHGIVATGFPRLGILGRSPDAVESDEPLLMEVETEVVPPDTHFEAQAGPSSTELPAPPTIPPLTQTQEVPPTQAEVAVTNPQAAARTTSQPIDAKKTLLWSAAALNNNSGQPQPGEADESNVPPMLRSLRQCKACGFPVSEGRTLCVECEEKKWRGQLRMPPPQATERPSAVSAKAPAVDFSGATQFAALRQAGASELGAVRPATSGAARILMPSATSAPAPAAPPKAADAFANQKPDLQKPNQETSTAPQNLTAAPRSANPSAASQPSAASVLPATLLEAMQAQPAASSAAVSVADRKPVSSAAPDPHVESASADLPILSSGLGSSQSWFSANKYIFGALALVAAVVAAIVYLR